MRIAGSTEDATVTKKKSARFYMVCRDPQEVVHNNPKQVYTSLEVAKKRAEELVKDSGRTFFILTPIAKVEPTSPPVLWTVIE